MRRIFGVIILLGILMLVIVGCDTSSQIVSHTSDTDSTPFQLTWEDFERKEEERKQRDLFEFVQACNDEVNEYRDKDTGVHYFILFESKGANGTGGAMCPRYNADGSLYVD